MDRPHWAIQAKLKAFHSQLREEVCPHIDLATNAITRQHAMNLNAPLSDSELFISRSLINALAKMSADNCDDANDVAQETWLAILGRTSGAILSAKAWLRATVRRRVASQARNRVRRRDVEILSYEESGSATPLESLATSGSNHLLHAKVDALEEKYASAIRLRYFEGMSRQDIARKLDIPLATAATRLQRALELLRERY